MSAEANRIAKSVEKRCDRYLKRAKQMGKNPEQKVIHHFRIASRNLLVIAPLLENSALWKRGVKQQLNELGPLRDLQVLSERLNTCEHIVCQNLEKTIAKELGSIDLSINKKFMKQLNCSCQASLRQIELSPETFNKKARARYKGAVAKLLHRLKKVDRNQPSSFHKLRIAYKAFRYVTLFLHEIGWLDDLDKKELKHWQELLGDIQDDEVAINWLQHNCPEESELIKSLKHHSEHAREQFIGDKKRFQQFVSSFASGI